MSGAVEPEALVVTHWFESGEDGEPYSATVRLAGRRAGIGGTPKASDTFVHEETIDGILPGSGPVSITTWVYGLQPGQWSVTADLIRPNSHRSRPSEWRRPRTERISPAAWSWRRRALSGGPAVPIKTRWAPLAPLARIPAVVPGSWTALAVLGSLFGLASQAAILAHDGVSLPRALVVSLPAITAGIVAMKLWYSLLHPRASLMAKAQGWSVDGFFVAAPPVAIIALLASNLPIGVFFDASTPGLFFAVAIGRIGCFLTGCCAGRWTRSRWGIWSSDRRVGARRIPAQLLESAVGLFIGVVATLLVFGHARAAPGLIFGAAVAAYILARQVLLRLRAERREYSWRRSSVLARA